MQHFLYSLLWVLLIISNAWGAVNKNLDTYHMLASKKIAGSKPVIPYAAKNQDLSRFFTGSSSGSGTNLLTNSALEISLGAFNSLFGSTNSASTISIGNLSYVTLGALILVPLIIGLALVFYLVGGSGAVLGTALRRTDDEFEARKLKLQ